MWKRQKHGENSEEAKTVERSTEVAGLYSQAAKTVVEHKNEEIVGATVLFLDVHSLMLAQGEATWSAFLLEDGLHLSPAGNNFVAGRLMNLLDTAVIEVESLPSELPWGSEVDSINFEESFQNHQLKYKADRIGQGNMLFRQRTPAHAGKNFDASGVAKVSSPQSQLRSVMENMNLYGDNNSSLFFSFAAVVVILCVALYSFINYFRAEYSQANKNQ